MNYFDYLRIKNKKDSRKVFVDYLIEIKDYPEELAIRESLIYYNTK